MFSFSLGFVFGWVFPIVVICICMLFRVDCSRVPSFLVVAFTFHVDCSFVLVFFVLAFDFLFVLVLLVFSVVFFVLVGGFVGVHVVLVFFVSSLLIRSFVGVFIFYSSVHVCSCSFRSCL